MTIEEERVSERDSLAWPDVVDDDPSPDWLYCSIIHGLPLLVEWEPVEKM